MRGESCIAGSRSAAVMVVQVFSQMKRLRPLTVCIPVTWFPDQGLDFNLKLDFVVTLQLDLGTVER